MSGDLRSRTRLAYNAISVFGEGVIAYSRAFLA